MQMIGHETVRKNHKPETGCLCQKLRSNAGYDRGVSENRTPLHDAYRYKITAQADVIDRVETSRPRHDAHRGCNIGTGTAVTTLWPMRCQSGDQRTHRERESCGTAE